MYVHIEGVNLPGRRCGPNPDGEMEVNVHVGVGTYRNPVDLVPGDAESAHWRIEVRAIPAVDGSVDFRGPFVEGKRGDRFLYLNWGTVAADGSFRMFRRAKIVLSAIEPSLVEQALRENGSLACAVNLTNAKGQPVCARVQPPAIAWRMIAGDQPT